jgi:carbon-monoxide dehydrogenase medium subunit
LECGVKPVNFEYARPIELSAAIALGGRNGAVVKFIAGGQSLGPMLNLRLIQPDLLVDITAIAELKHFEQKPDAIFIGACVTHADIEDGRVPDVTGGVMRAVASGIAYRAVRNRGTIGGSLVHADPSADWISALAMLGAQAFVRGREQDRRIPVETLMTGVFECSLSAGEILTGIEVPRLSQNACWGYFKHCRKTGDLADAIGAYLHDPDRAVCRAVIGATGTRPIVFRDAMAVFSDKPAGTLDRSSAERAMTEHGMTDPIERQLHFACLRRAVEQARRA